MNKEDTEIQEMIKDYLRQSGFKSTLECMEKEQNYMNLSDKKKVKILNIRIATQKQKNQS
jgi:hypothetical protein